MFTCSDHTFVVCAYGESPYLRDCILSLMKQEQPSRIIVSTSTPNKHIDRVASSFSLPVIINNGKPGIGHDWNCAISHAQTPLVTIAHQDDLYSSNYTIKMLCSVNASRHPLIFFSNYGEIRNGKYADDISILKVKRLILRKLASIGYSSLTKDKRRVLRFGSAICCPSVTYVITNLETPLFSSDMKCDLDWEAWERFSRLEGSFVYSSEILMHHRIHEGSETTSLILDNTRSSEDLAMLEKFWSKRVAKAIHLLYSLSMNSNAL